MGPVWVRRPCLGGTAGPQFALFIGGQILSVDVLHPRLSCSEFFLVRSSCDGVFPRIKAYCILNTQAGGLVG